MEDKDETGNARVLSHHCHMCGGKKAPVYTGQPGARQIWWLCPKCDNPS